MNHAEFVTWLECRIRGAQDDIESGGPKDVEYYKGRKDVYKIVFQEFELSFREEILADEADS